jgi:hypothetical protein
VAQATQQFWLMLFQGWEEHTRVRLRKLAPYLNTTSGDARLLRAWAIDQSVAYQEAVQQALSIDSMVLPTTGLIGGWAADGRRGGKIVSRPASWAWVRPCMGSSAAAQLQLPACRAPRCSLHSLLLLQGCSR